MIIQLFLRIPEEDVDLSIANNYHEKIKKVDEDLFLIKVRDTPKKIIELLERPLDFKITLPELEGVKHLIETYEDLFIFLKDYIDAKVKNEHSRGRLSILGILQSEMGQPMWNSKQDVREISQGSRT
ncbi:hypothetical protein P8X24_07160 [Pyrococcus kukulkanii]|uniref:hypothetical protein n=1 Tax=Pyrococcus kukulkanii TaxID=1609559 RepID=UPI0035660AE2